MRFEFIRKGLFASARGGHFVVCHQWNARNTSVSTKWEFMLGETLVKSMVYLQIVGPASGSRSFLSSGEHISTFNSLAP